MLSDSELKNLTHSTDALIAPPQETAIGQGKRQVVSFGSGISFTTVEFQCEFDEQAVTARCFNNHKLGNPFLNEPILFEEFINYVTGLIGGKPLISKTYDHPAQPEFLFWFSRRPRDIRKV